MDFTFLYDINQTTGAATQIGTGHGQTGTVGLDFAGDTLYGLVQSTGVLFTQPLTGGAGTLKFDSAYQYTGDVAFGGTDGSGNLILYGSSGSGLMKMTVNAAGTGGTEEIVGSLCKGFPAMDFAGDDLIGLATDKHAYKIDTRTAALTDLGLIGTNGFGGLPAGGMSAIAIPTPTAGLAGLALLCVLGAARHRRRRRAA